MKEREKVCLSKHSPGNRCFFWGLFLITLFSTNFAKAQRKITYKNFHPGQVWLDNNGKPINAHGGGILYHNGVYYWFGEHKIAGRIGNRAMVGVHVYSSKDLYNWIDRGIALHVSENPNSDIAKGCILERPKVIYNKKTGKFVMWFHLELKGHGYSSARAGVAVSDHPAGPYKYLYSFRPDAGKWPINVTDKDKIGDPHNYLARDFKGGQMSRDMTLFLDSDGKAYHIYTSENNRTTHISLLASDYLHPSGTYKRVFINRNMEAPAIFKRNGKYYFIGSGTTGWAPNAARSAEAPNIWGPWKELGNPCVGKDSALTFHSQSTFVLKVRGLKDAYIFMADRWRPENPIDGRYIWLPIKFKKGKPIIQWKDEWNLGYLNKN